MASYLDPLPLVICPQIQAVVSALRQGPRKSIDYRRPGRGVGTMGALDQFIELKALVLEAMEEHAAQPSGSSFPVDRLELLSPFLNVVVSSEVGGAATTAALRGVLKIIQAGALEAPTMSSQVALTEVIHAVKNCTFDSNDEVVVLSVIKVLVACAVCPSPALVSEASLRDVFETVFKTWRGFSIRSGALLRNEATNALDELLRCSLQHIAKPTPGFVPQSSPHQRFLCGVLAAVFRDLQDGSTQSARVLLQIRLLDGVLSRTDSVIPADPTMFTQVAVDAPFALIAGARCHGQSTAILAEMLPLVSRLIHACLAQSPSRLPGRADEIVGPIFGALQVEALVSNVFLRRLRSPAAESPESLVLLLESLSELLRNARVAAVLWLSFDLHLLRPNLLAELILAINSCAVACGPPGSTLPRARAETPQGVPATLSPPAGPPPPPGTTLTYVSDVAVWVLAGLFQCLLKAVLPAANLAGNKVFSEVVRVEAGTQIESMCESLGKCVALGEMLKACNEKPKKVARIFEDSGLAPDISVPDESEVPASEGHHRDIPEWARKLAVIFRLAPGVDYSMMGEFFGQPTQESTQAFTAFVDTFDWGDSDMEEAMRSLLQAYLLPKEAQQIDRIVKVFAYTFYQKHVARHSGLPFVRSKDAAYVLSFALILLNSDQHNPNMKAKRMEYKDFARNNRGQNTSSADIREILKNTEAGCPSIVKTKSPHGYSNGSKVTLSGIEGPKPLKRALNKDHVVTVLDDCSFSMAVDLSEVEGEVDLSSADPAGEHGDFPEDVQKKMYEKIREDEITTPPSGSLCESFTMARWRDLVQMCKSGFRDNALKAQSSNRQTSVAQIFAISSLLLDRMGGQVLQVFEYALLWDAQGESAAVAGVESMLRLALHCDRDSFADEAMQVLFSNASAVFSVQQLHLQKHRPGACMQAIFRVAAENPAILPPALLQVIAYAVLFFAAHGLFHVPKPDAATAKLAGVTWLPLVPPSSALSSIFSAMSSMLSFYDSDDEDHKSKPARSRKAHSVAGRRPAAPHSPAAIIRSTSEGTGLSVAERGPLTDEESDVAGSVADIAEGTPNGAHVEGQPPAVVPAEAASTHSAVPEDPLAQQIRCTFELCHAEATFAALSDPASGPVSRRLLCNLLLVLAYFHPHGAVEVDEPPSQAAKEPRCLSLPLPRKSPFLYPSLKESNPPRLELDAGEALLLCLGVLTSLLESGLDSYALEEVAFSLRVCLHRMIASVPDRGLKSPIIAVFRASAELLHRGVPCAWTVMVLQTLVDRGDTEVQSYCRLIVACVRHLCQSRSAVVLEKPEARPIWTVLLRLLLKASPASQSVPGVPNALPADVDQIRQEAWSQGLLFCLASPLLMKSVTDSRGDGLLTSFLQQLLSAPGVQPPILLDGYGHLLGRAIDSMKDDDAPPLSVLAVYWSRVAVALLQLVAGQSKGNRNFIVGAPVQHMVLTLNKHLLNVRVPDLLSQAETADCIRDVLEKLVSAITHMVSPTTPPQVIQALVGLLSKFFLQNLPLLQKNPQFDQIWLMVLRLLLLFVKQGTDASCEELSEVATESLKNVICVLLNAGLLQYVPPGAGKRGSAQALPAGVLMWWKVTWESIEGFCPGLGEELMEGMSERDGVGTSAEHEGVSADIATTSHSSVEGVTPADGAPP
mmetsp:Transcript_35762/g.80384  ORF Transcript_35762/g.80384 Transcript_35762/m.80384 type:complete len:1658 (+) Transcript_35762:107-5080(+)